MATKIQVKRGLSSNFASQNLSAGEPAFLTDTGKLYIGDGAKKTLINPIEKPSGISTTVSYTKVGVNEYGQVTEQANLLAKDIPNISTSQVTGLGTSAILNTGTSSGQIPVLDSTGKLPASVIPTILPLSANNIYASYSGTDITVAINQPLPLNSVVSSGSGLKINANGGINISVAGTYLITYNVSATAPILKVALSTTIGDSNILNGSMSSSSSASITPYTCVSATLLRKVTSEENIYIKNISIASIIFLNSSCNISVVRIA